MKPQIQIGLWLLLATGAAGLLSCKPDNQPTAKTKMELLTQASWKRTALVSDPAYDWYANGTSDTDVLSYMWSCEKDNLDIYRANGIVETNEGPSKCSASDPQTWDATWAFADNETKIVINGVDEYTIDELTETTLRLRSTFVENGVTYTHYEAYSH